MGEMDCTTPGCATVQVLRSDVVHLEERQDKIETNLEELIKSMRDHVPPWAARKLTTQGIAIGALTSAVVALFIAAFMQGGR